MPDATPEWEHAPPPELTVYPSDDEPTPALYGPKGEVIRWRARRRFGYRGNGDD